MHAYYSLTFFAKRFFMSALVCLESEENFVLYQYVRYVAQFFCFSVGAKMFSQDLFLSSLRNFRYDGKNCKSGRVTTIASQC